MAWTPRRLRSLLPALLLPWTLGGCATVLGTVMSPVTGGVDLVHQDVPSRAYLLVPPVFVAGAIAGPFVAVYNGVQYDASILRDWSGYWREFDSVFRPFELIRE